MCSFTSSCLCVLFFFFKQKTAYEMRISDWSSDVCSSDLVSAFCPLLRRLPPVSAQQDVGVLHQLGQRVFRHCPLAIEILRNLRLPVEVVQLRAQFRVRQRAVTHHHARRLDQSAFDGVVEAEVRHDPAEQAFIRSEEHTSEL